MRQIILITCFLSSLPILGFTQHSIARQWNEVLLESVRNDFARPTVHARNLFHLSAAMYDAWAAVTEDHDTYFLGKEVGGFSIPFDGIPMPGDIQSYREEAISYTAYRLLKHRFKNSPGFEESNKLMDDLFLSLGYDTLNVSTNYSDGSGAALGNYLALQVIEFGLQDGSNEINDYRNQYYRPSNWQFLAETPGNAPFINPNNWQPIAFETFIDQGGNVLPTNAPDFLSPEWGNVVPFAMGEEDAVSYERFGFEYKVYYDPGPPCLIDLQEPDEDTEEYKWGFSLVSIWGAHLDPNDGVMWDISPGAIGNIQDYPTTIPGLRDFYDRLEGGDPSIGHALNPHTGQPYAPQMVPRADYARVLAEFWADGPDSETPPGHWFTILNYVNDHPELEKRFKGQGGILDDLEWDVKAYFTLGGAMHDAAVSAWSIKGWYDYVRPISAIRSMASRGQSTDPTQPSYDPNGFELEEGFIELVRAGDPLAGANGENIGKIKLYTWRGPEYIANPETTTAGVGWILGENWWPFQRPTFITPPFAGYVSGHSTYSRAAAEVLTLLTGDPFFPGGMGVFKAPKNEFLVFEEGPSVDVELQWATYRDASDQTSLSRIWGGIHPPVDDIPGRLIGLEIGQEAFQFAESYFADQATNTENEWAELVGLEMSPNPASRQSGLRVQWKEPIGEGQLEIFTITGERMFELKLNPVFVDRSLTIDLSKFTLGTYLLHLSADQFQTSYKFIVVDE